MNRLWRAALVAALVGLASASDAQRPQRSMSMASDSTASQIVMSGIFGQLGYHIARAATESVSRPVRLDLPTDWPQWRSYAAHLLNSVRGRPLRATDSTSLRIALFTMYMRGDTLVAEFDIGSSWLCRGEWKGSSTAYELTAIRRGSAWEAARTRPVGYGDAATCH